MAPQLAPLAPALAIIAFAAAGAAAQGLAGLTENPPNGLADVQVGERGKLMRIALLCHDECRVGARSSGVFFIPGIAETLIVDLAGRAGNAERLAFSAEEGGTSLTIEAEKPIVAASIKRCVIDGASASCIDIEFAELLNLARLQAVPAPAPVIAAARPDGPVLREAPGADLLVFASLAPPERLAPPTALSPPPLGDDGPRLILDRKKAEALLGARVDIGAEAAEILGRRFSPEICAAADTRLKADAWALEAMVEIGFCEAIAGRLGPADGVFQRLLAYTPDNYPALVGRALVAARRGDRESAEARFQDALNALPPIAESDRIVAAMARL